MTMENSRKRKDLVSLANKAPSMLLTIIDRKLKYYDRQVNQNRYLFS